VLAAIGDLDLVARVIVDGAVSGLHRSPFHGYSAEFSQYRHYRPGDDLRYVDWKLFARTDRFYTKQYRETTNLVAGLAIDASRSMAYAGASGVAKIDYARMLGASLVHVIARQGDAPGLVVYDDDVREYIPCRTGRLHERRILLSLAKLEARGGTAPAGPLKRALDWLRRRGVLILISDLYEESAAIEDELKRAVRTGHEVVVFHLLTPEERTFPFQQDAEFEDLETGATVVATPRTVTDAYRREMDEFLRRWHGRCVSHGIDYVPLSTDTPLDTALRGFLIKRAGRADR
jgi:uncharacterized protein (DUF58 family)